MSANTTNKYQGTITSDDRELKDDAYQLKNDVSHINTYRRMVDMTNQVVSPQTRQGFYNGVKSFCIEQPYIASFLASQTAFSAIPVSIFAAFCLGVITLTAIAAFGFATFWIGTAVLVLIPILFITSSVALCAWVWAIGTFLLSRWVYNLIPVSVWGTTEIAMPSHKKFVINKGQGFGDVKIEVDEGWTSKSNGVDGATAHI